LALCLIHSRQFIAERRYLRLQGRDISRLDRVATGSTESVFGW
jgi:hypothetical protein